MGIVKELTEETTQEEFLELQRGDRLYFKGFPDHPYLVMTIDNPWIDLRNQWGTPNYINIKDYPKGDL